MCLSKKWWLEGVWNVNTLNTVMYKIIWRTPSVFADCFLIFVSKYLRYCSVALNEIVRFCLFRELRLEFLPHNQYWRLLPCWSRLQWWFRHLETGSPAAPRRKGDAIQTWWVRTREDDDTIAGPSSRRESPPSSNDDENDDDVPLMHLTPIQFATFF